MWEVSSESPLPPGVPRASAGSLPGPEGPSSLLASIQRRRENKKARKEARTYCRKPGRPSPRPRQFPFCLALPLPASPHRAKEAFLSVVPTMPPLLRGAGPLPGASGVPIHVHTVLLALSPCSVLPGHSDTPPLSRGRNVVGASDAPSPAPSSWKKALPVHAMEGARRARPMAPPRVVTPEGQ